MKKRVKRNNRMKSIILTALALVVFFFFILPLSFSLFNGSKGGNVALIPITGQITANGGSSFGQSFASAENIINSIRSAEDNPQVEVILLDINSPGGSAVASDDIADAVKKSSKPTIALIGELGASGGYWIASATDHIIANRMSITGSIGVISSYLEFSGLMEEYGVGYERLVAGEKKDIGTPFKKLDQEEKDLMQRKLDRIHDFFIQGVAENRKMSVDAVDELATGEFYLGVEALQLGLVDQLGNIGTAEQYISQKYGLERIDYIVYEHRPGLLSLFSAVADNFFFKIGQGMGSILFQQSYEGIKFM